jgi:anaphase-promoting complex subunit 11
MKITYTAYTAVAEWKWDLPEEADDTCGICRVQFEGTCAKCKYPGQECPIS